MDIPKILIINETCGIGSHGRICASIAHEYEKNGYEVTYAFGRDARVSEDCERYALKIGNSIDIYSHVLLTRIFDLHGFGSIRATRKFLRWADTYNPSIVWLHNLHGYYINVKLLFEWIKSKTNLKVMWTLHDCWAFTGHCSHFTAAKCEKWRDQCNKCPQKYEYPKSIFVDNSKLNYARKRGLFTNVKDLTIVTPSEWLAYRVRNSFLKEYNIKIVNNKVEREIFKPTPSSFKKKYGIEDKKIILGVSNIWNDRKGLNDFIELSQLLDSSYVIVLVGVDSKTEKLIPNSILTIPKVSSQNKLAEIYSCADVFVNPSIEETFGMTSMEAAMCGTKVIVYRGTACEEIANMYGGYVVERGANNIFKSIIEMEF